MKTRRGRHWLSGTMIGLTYLAAILATLPLLLILGHLLKKGASFVSVAFFTNMPRPVGEAGGGMANAIVGTLMLIAIASAIGLPIGIGAGIYLSEKRSTPFAHSVRFLSDVLNGLPHRDGNLRVGISGSPYGAFLGSRLGSRARSNDDSPRDENNGGDAPRRTSFAP